MTYYKIPRGQLVFGDAGGQCVIYYVIAIDDHHYCAYIDGGWVEIKSDAFEYWYEGKGGNLQRVSKLEIAVVCGKLYKEKEKE